ncbi:hypothetical protein AX768_24490 [Burkholderia sp. PAMC 28687]|uniref:DUF4148 domain-containing protein n=1 Tax=Burkholderia sp. PAMC 28687 TaxID=1795874 RepID=UPI000780F4DA|nr:DUF4148 domain-containing protein [Burkholderia sp. PAMC 28687]AMM17376.1 hypothetical protein AX768_24490 [Burkholderia sp. PAMC 28687]
MKALAITLVAIATIASANAFAQTKTRAEVYQELIQAQKDGRDFVTDTSYPDVNPIFAHQLEQQQTRLAQEQSNTTVASTPPVNASEAN